MKVHRGKVHKYLGMSLDLSHKGQCHVTMYDYLDGIQEAFDAAVEKHGDKLSVNEDCDKTGHPAECNYDKECQNCGVIMGGPKADPPRDAGRARCGRNSNAVFDMALDEDPEHQAIAEPEMQDAPPKMGMVAHNAWNRKQPKKYVPRMQGNKYQVALAQIGASKTSMAFAQMSVKKALETIKATHKKWGKDAEESVEVEKHRRDFDREYVLQSVSNDCGDSLLSSEMRYEYSHLEAARKETNPKLVLPLQYKNIVKDEKDRAFILVHWDKLCHLMEYLRGDCD